MSSDLRNVALTQYVAEVAGTDEFEVTESRTDYLLKLKANDENALKTLLKSFAQTGHQTDCIGRVVIVWLKPGDWLISAAMTRYNEAQEVSALAE